jgi:hypothetical protein
VGNKTKNTGVDCSKDKPVDNSPALDRSQSFKEHSAFFVYADPEMTASVPLNVPHLKSR